MTKGNRPVPSLAVILDEYSRAIMGYRLSFERPSTSQTALTLRQAIWGKEDGSFPACGIPDAFYTDHGSDFTSKHMEQVAANVSMQLIFSQPGRPRGRGKIERFFRTVRAMVLPGLPGYIPRAKRSYRSARKKQRKIVAMAGSPERQATLTLAQFEVLFRTWVLSTYHHRQQRRLKGAPLDRWQQGIWLPRLPESLAQLDLLLLCEGTTKQVHPEGIFFHGYRYMDTKLAGWVRKRVVVYYDPLDLATISVYIKDGPNEERFLCQARCQELGEQTVSLKELVSARNAQRKQLHVRLEERKREVEQFRSHLQRQKGLPVSENPPPTSKPVVSSGSQFLPPAFMLQIAPEFLPEEEASVSRREGCTNGV